MSPKIAMKSFEKQLNPSDREVVPGSGPPREVMALFTQAFLHGAHGVVADYAAIAQPWGFDVERHRHARWRSSTATRTRWCRCATARSSRSGCRVRELTVWPGAGHLGTITHVGDDPRRAAVGRCRSASMDAAVAAVRPRDRLAIPLGPGQPGAFLHALGERDDFEQLEVFGALLIDLYAVFTKPGVRLLSGFYGPAERFLRDSGANVEFIPSDFRRFSPIVERFHPRVVAAAVAPPDADGWMSLSLHSGAAWYELQRVIADPERIVIAETSPHFPRTFGLEPEFPHRVHVDEVDFVVETDREPYLLADAEPTPDRDRRSPSTCSPFIRSGATLQTGIGGIPSMVVQLLADGDAGDFGVHSEMFTTGLMQLHKAGKVSNRRKGQFDGFSVTTFAAGTAELYEWLDGNDEVRFLPVDIVNSPETISRNEEMVTINGALAVDLWGQVAADTLARAPVLRHRRPRGLRLGLGPRARRPRGDLPAVDRDIGGRCVSRIVPALPEGMLVTTPRHQLDLVVTEFGVAHLRGRTVRERAARARRRSRIPTSARTSSAAPRRLD